MLRINTFELFEMKKRCGKPFSLRLTEAPVPQNALCCHTCYILSEFHNDNDRTESGQSAIHHKPTSATGTKCQVSSTRASGVGAADRRHHGAGDVGGLRRAAEIGRQHAGGANLLDGGDQRRRGDRLA